MPVPLAMGLVGTEIYIVGASIARPFLTVFSAPSGRADAKDVSAPTMRATDGRPYELKSIPTKTMTARIAEICSDLVKNLCLHPCLPL